VEDNRTTIYGENGVLSLYGNPDFPLAVDYNHETGEYYRLGKKSTNIEQVKSGVIDAFVNALIEGIEVPIPGIEGFRALKAVIACQQSAETGKRVHIGSQP
jgi:predicted dehydrogenase